MAKPFVAGKKAAMMPLDRAMISVYRLSILTMSLFAADWPQCKVSVCSHHRCSNLWHNAELSSLVNIVAT